MTATPHRPTTTRDAARERRAAHPARGRRPRPRPRRHPALLAPPRLRATELPDRPHRPLLAQRRPPVARASVESSTGQALSLATVGDERDDEPWRASRSAFGTGARRGGRTTARQRANSATRPSTARSTPSGSSPASRTPKVDRHVRRPGPREGDHRRMGRRWLDGQTHLKPTTHERYAGILRKHIQPKWGNVKLSNVSHADVQAWVTALTTEHSPATVQKIHRVLSPGPRHGRQGRAARPQRRRRRSTCLASSSTSTAT